MNLTDLPAGCDDAVETLLTFHRRVERHLAQLGRLPEHIEAFGIGGEAMSIAASVLQCFGAAVALHHEDEERDLQRRLEADHREIHRTWRELRRALQAISEGMLRRLPVNEVQFYCAITTTHIAIEEGAVHALASRYLLPDDREGLARRMQARRAVMKSSSG